MTTADLVHREYWTPGEAARVMGRGADFWRHAFDRGSVTGYADGKRRYICAQSARDFLSAQPQRIAPVGGQDCAEAMRQFRASVRRRGFSLLETVIAMALIAICVVGSTTLIVFCLHQVEQSQAIAVETHRAASILADARSQFFLYEFRQWADAHAQDVDVRLVQDDGKTSEYMVMTHATRYCDPFVTLVSVRNDPEDNRGGILSRENME